MLPRHRKQQFQHDAQPADTTSRRCRRHLDRLGPHGSDIVLYETPKEFGAAFSQGKNLEWIQHELASLPAKEKSSGQSKSNNSAASIHGDARSSLH